MATLTVTFTNGKTLTRNTDKPYTHAWIATGGRNVEMGFTTSLEKAEKTARTYYSPREYKDVSWEVKAI